MTLDTRDYILGCLECCRNGTARRTQTQSSPRVDEPMILFGIDFIGLIPNSNLTLEETIQCCYPQLQYFNFETKGKLDYGYSGKGSFSHVFMAIDYFSRFVWAFPCAAPYQSKAIRCLIWLFGLFGCPIVIYANIGTHFAGSKMARFLKSQEVLYIPAPSAAKRATGMIEKANDLFERVMKGIAVKPDWPIYVHRAAYEMNRRKIKHLGHSPYEILFGYHPPSSLELAIPHIKRTKLMLDLQNFDFERLDSEEVMAEAVFHHVAKVEARRSDILRKDDWRRQVQKGKHDLGVSQYRNYTLGSLVMVYDHIHAKEKLHAAYRGPFVVTGYGGHNRKNFSIQQVNGERVKNTFHGDQLKPFRLREGYLVTEQEQTIPTYQNLRAGKAVVKKPRKYEHIRGAWKS
ncbi:hypothetical protein OnM2_049059 [Erysiphe neolycopersici]|uniref:Integrase catalytic domain-containing protein n=1 Tax=Erysiphe neolycopersici TaxID=212602 RepID=A0A420HT78_9PEZI|nr:hypothetical protein OnM2_049059 [Erysiphe neolycopersici]